MVERKFCWVLAASLVLGGCAQIVGLEDWTPLDQGGGGTSGDAGEDALSQDVSGDTQEPLECQSGAYRCQGVSLEQCHDNAWEKVDECASATLCNASTGTCDPPACETGAYRCQGERLEGCNQDQTGWETVETCDSAALCDEQKKSCLPPTCAADQHRCEGAILEVCNTDRTGWEAVETCATAAFCDAVGAQCLPPVCSPQEYSCDGKKLQVCNANQTGWSMVKNCGPNEICDAAGGECDICIGGTWQCAGASLQQCAPDGQSWIGVQTCGSPALCDAAQQVCLPASCETVAPGTGADCGSGENLSCCSIASVDGGLFNRSNDPTAPATVDSFRMDVFEVTVGRFRKFVSSGSGTQAKPPAAGAGAHPALPGSGWSSSWNTNLPANAPALQTALQCDPTYATWSNAAGTKERLPITCVTWYEAFAFCAWDGGRLATEAEWNYAAAGGDQQRVYPWGSTIDAPYAVYDCRGDGSAPGECDATDLLAVGSRSSEGDGRWGHADLAGNVAEWTRDAFADTYSVPCENCSMLTGALWVLRGGAFDSSAEQVTTHVRSSSSPLTRSGTIGIRCVRMR